MTNTGSTRSPGAVLFDIDGTLVDSSYVHINAWLHAFHAVGQAGVTADRAVYVADTVWDVKACGKAGVARVGVLTGGISAAELTEAGAVAVYEDCRALLRELDTSPLAVVWS